MSGHDYEVRVAPDRLHARTISWLVVAAVSVILLSVGIVFLIGIPPTRVATSLKGVAPREIGMIEQTLIETDRTGQVLTAAARERLSRYEWVDRDAGTVRIPVDRAFDLVRREAE